MSLYKRKDSPYWWIKLPPIRGELRDFYKSTGTGNKRQAQRLHDKLCADRWEFDKTGSSQHEHGTMPPLNGWKRLATSVRTNGTSP